MEGAVIRAIKSCNSSRNIVALQVAEPMLLVLSLRAQQMFFAAESTRACKMRQYALLLNWQRNNLAYNSQDFVPGITM